MARRCLLSATLALAVAAVVVGPSADALGSSREASAPTLTRATTVAGQPSPVPLVDSDGWQSQGGIWAVTLRSASVVGGETRISSTWTSPTFRARPHRTYFAFAVDIAHQGAVHQVNAFEQQVRLCVAGGGCSRWERLSGSGLPDEFTYAPGFRVSVGLGIGDGTLGEGFRGHVQWRFHQVQRGVDEQTMTMRVAVGAAAARLLRSRATSGASAGSG